MSGAPRPVDESIMNDLKDRLRKSRQVPLVKEAGWDRGTDPDYLAELVAYWADTYDWREHEERILDYPWVHTGSGDSGLLSIHRSAGTEAPTVVLLHGWPDSLLRFEKALPLLTDVNVVVPCWSDCDCDVESVFPGDDLVPAPREFGERFFDARTWDEEPSGGHFAAWEKPEAYVAGLRKAIALA